MTSRKVLLGFLVLGVLIRLAVAVYLGSEIDAPPMLTDQRSYNALGARLIEGHGFSFSVGWYPFTPPETPTAHWSYLYSIFVAAIYALVGPNVLTARLVQAVLVGFLLPYAVYRLAQRIFPTRPQVASWALLLTVSYAYFILYAATLMTESLYIIALVWSLTVALEIEGHLRQGRRLPARLPWEFGLSLAFAALLRQSILPWLPVLFLWLLWRGWRGLGAAEPRGDGSRETAEAVSSVGRFTHNTVVPLVIAGVMVVASIAPFTVRNYMVYDSFLLLNSSTGYAMYSAQHPMHGYRFSEFAAAPLPEDLVGQGLNEAQLDSELLRRGFQFVLDEPVRYLRLSLSRVRAYLSVLPGEETSTLHAVGRIVGFGAYAPLMLYGFYLAMRASGLRTQLALPMLFVLFYSVLHILTWAMVRYRLPVDAVAMPFAALAVQDIWVRLPWARVSRGEAVQWQTPHGTGKPSP